jgi:hypothetical protein
MNKNNKFIFIFLFVHTHLFYYVFFYFLSLYFFNLHFWAGLDPASPAQSLAQANDPAGQKN